MKQPNERGFRPWGEDGPLVVPVEPQNIPPENSDLTTWGMRILRGVSRSGTGVRQLAENLNSLGDYGGFMHMIDQLVESGYLTKDANSYVYLTDKATQELHR